MGRAFGHWTARYVFDRTRVMLYKRMYPDRPWISQDMTKILESWLKPSDVGLEWGSGRSTIWLTKRVGSLTSVEHNPKWAEVVRGKICDNGLAEQVDYRLEVDGGGSEGDCNYVNVIREFEDNSLDFCFVDRMLRADCALGCLDKIKPGGILIIDNVEIYIPRSPKSRCPNARGLEDGFASEKWQEFAKMVDDWRYIQTTNGIYDTVLYVKHHC